MIISNLVELFAVKAQSPLASSEWRLTAFGSRPPVVAPARESYYLLIRRLPSTIVAKKGCCNWLTLFVIRISSFHLIQIVSD